MSRGRYKLYRNCLLFVERRGRGGEWTWWRAGRGIEWKPRMCRAWPQLAHSLLFAFFQRSLSPPSIPLPSLPPSSSPPPAMPSTLSTIPDAIRTRITLWLHNVIPRKHISRYVSLSTLSQLSIFFAFLAPPWGCGGVKGCRHLHRCTMPRLSPR